MYVNKSNVDIELAKLEAYRSDVKFSSFFNIVSQLCELDSKFDSTPRDEDTKQNIELLIQKLNSQKDEIAKLTKKDDKIGYDAVYKIIDNEFEELQNL